jgi:hypothetical protein
VNRAESSIEKRGQRAHLACVRRRKPERVACEMVAAEGSHKNPVTILGYVRMFGCVQNRNVLVGEPVSRFLNLCLYTLECAAIVVVAKVLNVFKQKDLWLFLSKFADEANDFEEQHPTFLVLESPFLACDRERLARTAGCSLSPTTVSDSMGL